MALERDVRVHGHVLVVCVGIIAGCAGLAGAQTEGLVRGQVVAAADGTSVPQATVTLDSSAAGEPVRADVDAEGRFLFRGLRAGRHVLSVAADGFAPREMPIVLEPREVRTVAIALDVAGIAETVSVESTPLPSAHSPSSTVVTSDRLEAMPAGQRTGIADALVTLAPGMIRGHDDFVHVRGHEVALNPIINGVSFWENPHALFSGGLSPSVIETANVMTGGFSAEYGNRFGGVVDIVTKSGLALPGRGSLTVNGGEAGRRGASGEFGGGGNRLGYYAFGTVFHSDRFLSPPDPVAIHDSGVGAHLFAQVDRGLERAGALRGILMVDATQFDVPRTPQDLDLRPLAGAEQRTRQQSAILGWTRGWSDTLASVTGYQRWSRARLLPAAGPLTATADVARELLTVGVKGDVSRTAGRHNVKAGIDAVRLAPREELAYTYEGYRELTHLLGLPHIHVAVPTVAFAGEEAGGQISAYVQDDMRLGGRVTMDLGVRIDRYDLLVSTTHASPRVNLAVRALGGSVLHASYNRFFVPPPVEGVLSSSAGLTQAIREIGAPLPPIEPTIEDQFEAGVAIPFRPVEIGATGYFRATDNPVHTTVWPDSRIYSYASFDRARAYGLELKAETRGLARYGVTGYVNYALARVNFYNPVTGGFVTEAAHISESSRFPGPMDQTHTLTGGVTYTHARSGLWAGTSIEYGSGTPIGHGGGAHEHADGTEDHAHASSSGLPDRVPSHTTVNVSLGVDLLRAAAGRSRMTLRLDVENISNRSYLIAQEGEFSPTQYSIPRLVSATLSVRF